MGELVTWSRILKTRSTPLTLNSSWLKAKGLISFSSSSSLAAWPQKHQEEALVPGSDLRAQTGKQHATRSSVFSQEEYGVSSHAASSQAQVQPLPGYVALLKS